MHIETNPILWHDPFWFALEQVIRAIRKRPNFVLSRTDHVDGLNRTAINRLAKEAALSDRQVFEVRNDEGKDGRIVTRWLQVNHPGLADSIEVKVWERLGDPIRQSDVEDVIDYLLAWQGARAKQLKAIPGSDDGGSAAERSAARRTQRHTDTAAPATDWRDVQRQLLEMCDNGVAYSNLRDLMERTGCRSTSTVSKAIKRSTTLNAWQARYTKGKASPRASSLTEVHLDKIGQTRELDPAKEAETNDVEIVFARLIREAQPEERAKLNDMTAEQRRQLVALVQNDPDRYDRVLGRKP